MFLSLCVAGCIYVCMRAVICSDDEAGPAPPPGLDKPKKKRKVLEFQHVYLDNLPCGAMYERSFMHQNTVTHVEWTKSNFLVTASSEGHIKFWKKKAGEIEFIKRYCAHLGPVTGLSGAKDGAPPAESPQLPMLVHVVVVTYCLAWRATPL